MTKLLGLSDIAAGAVFVASFYKLDIPGGLIMALGIYLVIKGIIFIMNFFSLIDIAAGILLIFGFSASVPPFLLLGIAAFLGVKGLMSIFAFS